MQKKTCIKWNRQYGNEKNKVKSKASTSYKASKI